MITENRSLDPSIINGTLKLSNFSRFLLPMVMIWQELHHRKQHRDYLQISTENLMNEIPWDELQDMIHSWVRDLEVVVEQLYGNERRVAMAIFRDLGEPVWVGCFSNIAKPEIQKFMRFGDIFSTTEPYPERLFALLEMFASMDNCEPTIHEVFAGLSCGEISSQYLELSNKVINFRHFASFLLRLV